ncbi:MAG: dTMP kinase [Methanobacteriaceae archaeon]|nr:dTMP kinase [Methanobacteriaceae archaeon]
MYIILEGIDGTGKTTQTKLLTEDLKEKGYNATQVIEPTNSEIGKLIRKYLQDKDSTTSNKQDILALLFAADRLTLKNTLKKVKGNKKEIIISDRSYYSSLAYQNNDIWVKDLNKKAVKPDIIIILDMPVKEALTRCMKQDTFETQEFLIQTKENYLNIAKKENIPIVKANQSIEKVQNDIKKIVYEKINEL